MTASNVRSSFNKRRTYLDLIEDKVLAGLRHHLAHPVVIEKFIETYNAERRMLAKEASRERDALERRISGVDRQISNMVDVLANGAGGAVASIVTKLKELEAEKVKLTAELAAKGQDDTVLRLHPRAAERYQCALEKLGDTLRNASTEERELIRSLIQSVTVFNEPDGTVSVDVSGRMMHLCVDRW